MRPGVQPPRVLAAPLAPPLVPAPARRLALNVVLIMALCTVAADGHAAGKTCGAIQNSFGPFDYTLASNAVSLATVEPYHFTAEVEQGVRGATGPLGGDLDYTLRAFPNHARALATMGRIGVRDKVMQVSGAKYPVECYFVRALEFQPDDPAVHAAYGNYLMALGKLQPALARMRQAVLLAPDNATYNYNLGLLYFRLKDYEHANDHAARAYAAGFPLPGLRQLLVSAGQWRAPPP